MSKSTYMMPKHFQHALASLPHPLENVLELGFYLASYANQFLLVCAFVHCSNGFFYFEWLLRNRLFVVQYVNNDKDGNYIGVKKRQIKMRIKDIKQITALSRLNVKEDIRQNFKNAETTLTDEQIWAPINNSWHMMLNKRNHTLNLRIF